MREKSRRPAVACPPAPRPAERLPGARRRRGRPPFSPGLAELDNPTLLREYAATRDLRLRNELVLRYERLARYLVGRFAASSAAPPEDLLQVAYLGLIASIERYDPDMGVRFTTFATPTILGIIKRYLRDQTWFLSAPRRVRDLATRLRGIRARLEQRLGRAPTVPEMAEAAGVAQEQVLLAMEVDQIYQPASLDTLCEEEPGGGARNGNEAIGAMDPAFAEIERRECVRHALACLDQRERAIIYGRFFEEESQAQVASRLGISQMHVSRLERRALQRLRGILACCGL